MDNEVIIDHHELFGPVVLGTNKCGKDLPALLRCAEEGLDEFESQRSHIVSNSINFKSLLRTEPKTFRS